ncbi:alkylphosphonate utilization protein [Mammaliicoccus sciuri]|uniref:alkylphosphonate utilization protein n=1 Tax=Mammaliicoccus sciuri TaxID=1296 RepID=UPI00226F3EA5|nr:alkylphosphonate utilization protein [Mammaliicoccus sciuri]MCY1028976.1 alkylphosphonate utilization protein [Mammaliicoccus sciuri]
MEATLPNCPKCDSEYTYEDGQFYICPMCNHEWSINDEDASNEENTVIKDVNGKGSSNSIKQGTKVKGIKLVDPEDGHDIDCKIPGFGQIGLKSSVVKKVNK